MAHFQWFSLTKNQMTFFCLCILLLISASIWSLVALISMSSVFCPQLPPSFVLAPLALSQVVCMIVVGSGLFPCACVRRPEVDLRFLLSLSPHFWRQDSLGEAGGHGVASLAGRQFPGLPTSISPASAPPFTWLIGI